MAIDALIELLAADLGRERPLTTPVLAHIAAEYNIPSDELPRFFSERLPRLEEYEVEICFSRLFTPDADLGARAAALLPDSGLSEAEERQVVETLTGRRITCTLTEGANRYTLEVAPVLVERYVRLLDLRAALDPEVARLIEEAVPEAERPAARHWCRLPQWRSEERARLLAAWLAAVGEQGRFRLERLTYLTGLVKTYRPHDLDDLDRQLTNLADALDHLDDKPFYSEELEESHAAKHAAADHVALRRAEIAREQALTAALREDLKAMAGGGEEAPQP